MASRRFSSASRKSSRRPPRGSRGTAPPARSGRFTRVAVLAVVLGVVIGAGLSCQSRQAQTPEQGVARSPEPATRSSPASPQAEQSPVPAASPEAPSREGPRVAIVFDDAGGSLADVEEIIAIGRPVTVAVLPGLTHSPEVARRATAAGLEVILHLPIEPSDSSHALGPDGITVSMDDTEIRDTVREALRSVPGAVGVNSHMGSRGTTDRRVMRSVMGVLREQGLYFVDSRTAAGSVGERVAREAGVRTASRTIFLDNVNEEEAIRTVVQRLISLARTRGEAIAIGHAQRLTPRVIAQMREEFDRQGIRLVGLSALVH